MSRTLVIVPAAGAGTRFGGAMPKQFLPLAGKPILLHVIERFFIDERVSQIVVAVAEPLLANVKQTERTRFVAGGATRQESVARALEAAGDEFDLVAVHDAVRPFFQPAMFHALLDAAAENGASVPILEVTDTIHILRDGFVAATPARSTLGAAQTPQCFRFDVLRDILARAAAEGVDNTDEAGLAAQYGYAVKAIEGDAMNFKITRAEDLELAERVIADQHRSDS